jgi:hypothetical protein
MKFIELTYVLIFASYMLATVAVFIISVLTFDSVIRTKYPRMLDIAVACLFAAVSLAIVEVLR